MSDSALAKKSTAPAKNPNAFDDDFLQRLEYLSLLSKRVFGGQLLAQRRTRQVGGGVEFADHRDYIPGDDLRHLDWRVYARHGDTLIKRFQEEKDLHVYLFVDVSASMRRSDDATRITASNRSGSKTIEKAWLARKLAAALAHIALSDLDRVSVLACGGRLNEMLPPVRGKDQILPIMKFLEAAESNDERTDFESVVAGFLSRSPRPGLAILLSDLFDHGKQAVETSTDSAHSGQKAASQKEDVPVTRFTAGVDRLRYANFEPHVIQIHTPGEADPSLLGDVELVDCETSRQKRLTVDARKLRRYRQLFSEFIDSCKSYCVRRDIPHTIATTDVPFDHVIMAMMRSAAVGA
ncbi:MAG: DUF58 domain-containing protein [Planctomycetota bacterium]